MRSFILPGILAVLVLLAAITASAVSYNVSGSVSYGDMALVLAAIAIGVLSERLYETDKKIEELKEELQEKSLSTQYSDEETDVDDDTENDQGIH
jgi:DNA-binding MltR family transcriptional regulator